MKILLTVHQFFPEFRAGTEVLTLSVARELLRRGHEVNVYTGYPSEKERLEENRFDEYLFDGIQVYRFHHAHVAMGGQTSRIAVSYDNRLAAEYFDKILLSFKPEVVHFFHLNRLGTRLIDKANQLGVRAFMTLTDFWAICPTGQLSLPDRKTCQGPNTSAGNCVRHFAQIRLKNLVPNWVPVRVFNWFAILASKDFSPAYPIFIEGRALNERLRINISRLNHLHKIFVPNRMMRDLLIRHGAAPGLIVESAYGIDVVENRADSRVRIPRYPLQIGFIGTLGEHKGCHVLIEAFSALPHNAARLKIYGDLQDFPDYVKQLYLRAKGYDNIEFCGTFPNAEMPEVLADLDVLIVPSVWQENTPLVIYSAQAARCPVVASDVEGISAAIVDGDNGLLFESGDVGALTNQLLRLINEDELLARLSANARQPKSISTYVDELLDVWLAV